MCWPTSNRAAIRSTRALSRCRTALGLWQFADGVEVMGFQSLNDQLSSIDFFIDKRIGSAAYRLLLTREIEN